MNAGILRLPLAGLGVALALAAAPAGAQQESTTTTSFDGWALSCVSRTDKSTGAVKACEVRTTVVLKDEKTGQQGVAAVIAIGRGAVGQPLQALVQVPLAALLTVPAKLLTADDKPIVELAYLACQAQGCTATAPISETQLSALGMSADKIFVTYANQLGQSLKIEANAKGLGAALAALGKEK